MHGTCASINAIWQKVSPAVSYAALKRVIIMQHVFDVQAARQLLLQQLLQTVMRMTGTYQRPREVGLYQNFALRFCMLSVLLASVLSSTSVICKSAYAMIAELIPHRGC